MSPRFFIERPVFATVMAIVLVIAGLVAGRSLPVAQYPEIAPPTVQVIATYPGASAETLARTVAAPLEEQLSGVERLLYYGSSSSSNGQTTITITFEVGTDIDKATANVNNRVQLATPRLPDEVRRNGIVVAKQSNNFLLVFAVHSPDNSRDTLFLSNYVTQNVVDELKRVPGVADVFIFGARDYAMRLWLNPDRMAQLGITTSRHRRGGGRAERAVRRRAHRRAALAARPAARVHGDRARPPGRARAVRRDRAARRTAGKGGVLRLKDVARIELGAQAYDTSNSVNGRPAIALAVMLASGANALQVGDGVKARMDELRPAASPRAWPASCPTTPRCSSRPRSARSAPPSSRPR
jgi:multidrug efflux pump